MPRINEAHIIVMESITGALLQLMEHKPLAEITVAELCRRAGISRISFYRNFKSKEDILVLHLKACTDEWWEAFIKSCPPEEFPNRFWNELLGQYRSNRHLIELIYKNDVSYLLKEHIFSCCGPKPENNDEDAFLFATLAGAIYGIVDEWIKRGMHDLPKNFSILKVASMMQKGVSINE